MQSRRFLSLPALLVAAFVVGASFTAGGFWAYQGLTGGQDVAAAGNTGSTPTTQTAPVLGVNTVADIVQQASPAVVQINTVVKSQAPDNPFFNDPFFRQFFGNTPFATQPQEQHGLGSGFIISKDGLILTNDHVIEGASQIDVTVAGHDKPFPAKVVGSDYDLDLAVLKISAPTNLPTLTLGDSDKARVGDWVVAIGNPYGLTHTTTVGVISAEGRPITVNDGNRTRRYKNLLQTDASINPGNSGGPLLNLKGEVIGINTAVSTQGQGLGFAIPTSTVKSVLNELISKGHVVRPWLGVAIQDVTPEIAKYMKLDRSQGALVDQVAQGSPAAQAGIQQGDVITQFNGNPIKTADELIKAVQNAKVGQKVVVEVWRGGAPRYLVVTLGDRGQQGG